MLKFAMTPEGRLLIIAVALTWLVVYVLWPTRIRPRLRKWFTPKRIIPFIELDEALVCQRTHGFWCKLAVPVARIHHVMDGNDEHASGFIGWDPDPTFPCVLIFTDTHTILAKGSYSDFLARYGEIIP